MREVGILVVLTNFASNKGDKTLLFAFIVLYKNYFLPLHENLKDQMFYFSLMIELKFVSCCVCYDKQSRCCSFILKYVVVNCNFDWFNTFKQNGFTETQ